ncbi:alpha/beta hydrolase family protein [Delftia sp. PS-11]|uniref:alpha/beta hydrolase family protein n=1 Tax=Delftia sp. PS-11 TaxID=2767222 RepID=UPI002456BA13|nr:alpha/beta fold hydrolase [Delftia sp. PS-11]KAJ8744888.1 alpha/beta fold hydrolase [Delftia sp. PS-11]
MTLFRRLVRHGALATAAFLALASAAHAQNAGFRTLTAAGEIPVTAALFYPTKAAVSTIPMGPWQISVAPGSAADQAPFKGLILISHGTGGMELNQHNLATRLASDGYLVAAVRHPGDNWQDRSMITSGRYFSERPRQLTQVLDTLLADPQWGPRIPLERIGAVGHSAGGYSVLALAGAQAEPQRAVRHCSMVQDDPGFCALAKDSSPAQSSGGQPAYAPGHMAPMELVADHRIRAVVALAPMAVVFTPESLAAITVPVKLMMAEKDDVLNGKYHGGHVAAHLPGAQTTVVPGAGHFAFMASPGVPLPSAAGDAASNPPGFDRQAFLPELENQVAAFFAQQWR